MTRHPTMPLAAALAALVLLLAGCGDDGDGDSGGGDRPTVAEMADVLSTKGQLSDDQAECVAQAFVDSDISDDGLRAILEAGNISGLGTDASAEDTTAVQGATEDAIACATQGAIDEIQDSTTTTVAG